jgi:hypothetical protein
MSIGPIAPISQERILAAGILVLLDLRGLKPTKEQHAKVNAAAGLAKLDL